MGAGIGESAWRWWAGLLPQRQVLDAAGEVLRLQDLCHQPQVVDALANGDAQLVRVNNAGKYRARSLPLRAFVQKILVPREQHAIQRQGSIEQRRVQEAPAAIFLRG